MNDASRSKAELLAEVGRLRQRVTELESSTRMMRRAMDTLRETDGSYRLVVEEFPQGIVIVKDGPPRVIYANEAAARITGQAVDDLMKLPAKVWLDFVHDDDREQVAALFAGGISRLREPVATAFRMIRPDGVERLVEFSANRLHTKGRDTVHATFADVTGLQEAAAEEGAPPHLQGVFQVAPHACFFTDLNGALVDWNPAAEAMLGLEADEPPGRGLLDPDFLSKQDRTTLRELLRQNSKGRPAGPEEVVLLRADGSSVAAEISTQPIQVDGATLILCMAVDVTAARRAREALLGQQERFELLLNTVFDGINICEYDPQTRRKRLVYCNDRFVEMSGYARADLEEAEDLNELFNHHLTPEELEEYHQLIVKGKPYTGTSSWRRPDGVENVHEFSAVSVPVGDRFQLVGVDRDITEKVRSAQALEESERRFRGLVETSFDGINICEHDPQTGARRLRFCNDRYVEMSGRSREELMALDDLQEVLGSLLPPDETRELDRRMLEGELVRGLATWHRPDGRPNVYEYAAVAVPVGDKLHIYGFDRDITEQRQVEEALRESEERFQLMASNVQDGLNVCEWDPEGRTRRLIWCNDRFVEMSGYSRDELMAAESLEDLVVVDRTLDEIGDMDRRIEEGKAFRGVASWKRPDGAENQYEFTAVAVPDGDVYRIYGVDRDVTEQKEAEAALRESEERFRLLVENAFDGINICRYDVETGTHRLVFCNERYAEMAGRSIEELMAADELDRFLAPMLSEDEARANVEAITRGDPFRGIGSWERPDGRENVHEFIGVPVEIDGEWHVIGIDRDVTDQKKAEEALRESEERFRSLVETAFDGINIVEYDPDTGSRRLIFCNDRYVEMSGYSREELESCENLAELIQPTMPDDERERNRELARQGKPFRGTSSWNRPDGLENVHEFSAVPIRVGDKWHVIGVDREVTEQKKAEEALRHSQELFRLLVDNTLDGINICEYDVNTGARRLVFCNDRFVEMSGYSREQLEECEDLNSLEDAQVPQSELDALQDQLLAGRPIRGISAWHRPDGKPNLHEFSAVLIERDGRPHVIGIDRDVTEAKEAELALRESEERFRHVVERAFDGISICEWDAEAGTRRLLFCNDRYVGMSGYTREELLACGNLDDLVDISDEEAARGDELYSTLRAGEPVTGVASWRRPDGEENVYEFSSFAMPAGDGLYNIIGVDRDITERIRAEEAVRESERRYRRLFEQSNDAVLIHDVGGDILQVNERACDLFGYSRDELQAMRVYDLQPEELHDETAALLDRMAGGEGTYAETQALTADGRAIDVEVSGSIVDDRGTLQSIVRDITERKASEEALRQSEERFRLLVDTAFDGINICDYDPETQRRRLVFCNDRYVEMSGYPREELMACEDLDSLAVPHWSAEEEEDQLARKEQGLPFFGLNSWQRPDGAENYYEWSAVLVQIGDQYRTFGVDRDITDRMKAERALRVSEERFRLLVDTAFDGINICEADEATLKCRLVFCNDRFVEMSGHGREDLLASDDVWSMTWTEETDEEKAQREEQLLAGNPVRGVAHWRRPDGRENTYEFSSISVRMDGKLYVMGVDRDITERRKSEEALRRSEERFRSVVESAFDGISITALDPVADVRTLVFCNSRFVEMSGYSREELEKCPNLNDLIDMQVPQEQLDEMRAAIRSGEPFRTTMSWRRPDLVHNIVESSAVALKVGELYHLVSVDRDVTVRVDAEEERRALEDQMRQAQKLESLGVLAGGIAHDFNNLLTGVLGNAGLALSELSPESPARYSVEQIQLSAQHAAELCRQMLAYSGKGQFVIQALNVSRLIREISHLIDVALSKKAVLEYHLADDLPSVEGDATQLRQVVMNLLTNAAEAIGDRSGLVIVRTGVMHVGRNYLAEALLGEELEEGKYVFLEVTDTGSGMDEETRERIFEPFFTTKFTGRGLGLAAVLGIVRGHGGAIRVESAPGQGTTFEVILPPTTREAAPTETRRSDTTSDWTGSGTILVVDDEEVVRVVSRRTLERAGFDVLTAGDGEEGVELFGEHADEIRLVLLDLTMPKMDGQDAFRHMKEIRPDVRGILLSGYTQDDAGSQFCDDGLAGFVQKPYDPATLLEAIRTILED